MIIFYDFDGVLADTHENLLRLYNKDFDDTVSKSDITEWNLASFVKPEAKTKIFDYLFSEGFYDNVKPNKDFIEAAKRNIELGHTVGVATACNNNVTMISGKLAWLEKHCPFIDLKNLIIVDNKGLLKGDLLVDDKLQNLEDFVAANPLGKGLLVRMAHNQNDVLLTPRIKHTTRTY